MRQIVLDTETTGLDPAAGHRIIEIGCVELVERRPTRSTFHRYLNPERDVESGAEAVHGLSNAFLRDKPRFAEVATVLLDYLRGAELIIHNAAFDLGFLNHELAQWQADAPRIEDLCGVIDTLLLARALHPGQRNSLDALCKRYLVDYSRRDLHGALLDAEILADVYLAMTGGQVSLHLGGDNGPQPGQALVAEVRRIPRERPPLPVVRASAVEQAAHEARLAAIRAASGGLCVWLDAGPRADCAAD